MWVLRRQVFGRPVYFWLVWTAAAVSLAASPMLLTDPAALSFLVDPELLVLVVAVAAIYARVELGVLRLRLRTGRRQVTARPAPRLGR
ncbi:MAG TPA: hypothetical protein VHV76_08950 [Mycobacteriales bacterium]|jgi:hypothetical protein|nr:hypothetical protein [Mycobacteriales bacterium]